MVSSRTTAIKDEMLAAQWRVCRLAFRRRSGEGRFLQLARETTVDWGDLRRDRLLGHAASPIWGVRRGMPHTFRVHRQLRRGWRNATGRARLPKRLSIPHKHHVDKIHVEGCPGERLLAVRLRRAARK